MMPTIVEDKLPISMRNVRISYGTTNWQFRPIADTKVDSSSRSHVDLEAMTPNITSNTRNNLLWPVAKRGAVTRDVWSQDKSDLSASMMPTIVEDKLPISMRNVRISYGTTNWQFRPIADTKVDSSSRSHVDLEAVTRASLVNRLTVVAAFDTMAAMPNIAPSDRCARMCLQFLSEP